MEKPRLNGRQRRLWQMHDFARGRGLEIGPLHNVSVAREHADVYYLDVFDRPRLLENYASHTNVNPDLIPEIDFALHDGNRVRSIPETLADLEPFDWVMASHVIEHVPDVIGWLDELAQVTVDGGRLVLVVPDRRYCFDVHRPGTTVGQLLQSHELGERVPSIRAVYDYKRGHAGTNARDLWDGLAPTYARRLHSLDQVREQVDLARKGDYIDSHVWTFTPGTLLEQLIELRALGLSDWVIESQELTRRNENEFFMVLRRLPRGGGWSADEFAHEPIPPDMPDWLEEWVTLRAELKEARAKLRRRRRRIKRLQMRLDEVRGSVRWRVGGVLTAPARGLRRLRALTDSRD